MADNTTLNPGSGGDKIHTDDLAAGTYKMAASKVIFGADGVNDGYWSAGAGAVNATTGRVTLASDDPAVALLGTMDSDTGSIVTNTTDIPSVIGTDGTAGPAKAVSIAGTEAAGTLQEIRVDSDGHPQVDVLSSALPTGAATSANQTTANSSLSSIATSTAKLPSLATPSGDNAPAVAGQPGYAQLMYYDGTGWDRGRGTAEDGMLVNLGTNNDVSVTGTVAVTDNSGSLTVDAPAGTPVNVQVGDGSNTATIRNLAANDALNVAIVDAAGDQVTSFGGSNASVFVDDADWTALTSSHTLAGGVFQSTPGTITDGDTGPFRVTANGYLMTRVEEVATGVAGTQYTEDDAAAANPVGTVTMMVRQDTPASEVSATGDNIAARATQYGAQYCQILDSSGNFVDTFGGSGGTAAADDADFVAGTTQGTLIQGVFESSPTSVTDGDMGAVGITQTRAMKTHIAGQAADLTIADGGNAITVDWNGTAPPIGAGTEAAALRVTLATDSTGVVSVDDNGGALTVDNGGTFAVQVDAALPAGTNAIGKLAANSGVDIGDVDILSIAAGSNLIGDVGLAGTRTSGGTTPYKNLDVDETEDQVKATAGQVYWIHAMNLASAPRYLKLYNATAATVVVGTTTPDMTIPLPSQGDTNGAGTYMAIPNGIAFGTAITVAATTGVADNDTGAPGANEVVLNLGYA